MGREQAAAWWLEAGVTGPRQGVTETRLGGFRDLSGAATWAVRTRGKCGAESRCISLLELL